MAPPHTEIADEISTGAMMQPTGADGQSVKMSFPKPPVFSDKLAERQYLKERLAAAYRIFAKEGFDEGVAGHITIRDPVDPTTFWVNPFGIHFALITASCLLHVDHEGRILPDSGPHRILNTAAFAIHSAIHHARPDVNCAAHTHAIHGRAFSTLHKELDIISQDSCAFYNDHAVYKEFNGVVLQEEEGFKIAETLGNRKAVLLGNHGILTTGKTIESCIFWFVSMEKCCKVQLMADAAGKTVKVTEADAIETYKIVGTESAGWFSGKPLFDLIDKETGGDYKL
ncbi:class II aldolase/adducin N-terminal [Pyronema domesticum]|jgi:ribulose-5-phosphate 4-epimerase/fuculose-1-phosphate aldolase|uniref:Similar to Meiotically up-regulated gene 14 protein acc. no. Q9P5M9 n=1 Tax=Pyronema omphalodes (strain CBS 100304) TaxID=1076935 RepID=U4LJN6_PYROM|nr:class II aldolase/adducin N-terminal [Pyronema domesticum]CCX29590.1 Similar to Meiotically up-regulated gene 14 protein; acc. no. Q9P5M9 [Pyronema omphalodes CBS 100304]